MYKQRAPHNRNGTTTRSRQPRVEEPPKRIVATYEMDPQTFVRHFNARHADALAPNQPELPENIDYNVWQLYVAYHRRLHLKKLPHYHDPDPPEAAIDRCIELIIENRDWGWKEIAGVSGFFAAFPDGSIATRVDGKIIYHDDISDATDRLVEATTNSINKIKKAARR